MFTRGDRRTSSLFIFDYLTTNLAENERFAGFKVTTECTGSVCKLRSDELVRGEDRGRDGVLFSNNELVRGEDRRRDVVLFSSYQLVRSEDHGRTGKFE
ncbi:hypothetical protein Scep_001914 [Stephania cephalantha]|uniref:Uncharacterized protein n=1 Tax=Stephania cephalantha TaxID=152367 RepID=A0AAP0L927_9MAGN